jgi:adenine C2-methylase RlmN of 23S rRNA A2503 and tRNA A37
MPCFVRKPRGLDVYAACGQLKRMETQIVDFPTSRSIS